MRNNTEITKLISAFVIGDGHLSPIDEDDGLSRHGRRANSRYSLTQIAAHRDYVEWQADVLSQLTEVRITEKSAWQDTHGTNRQDTMYLRTRSLPVYTTLRRRWYNANKKVLSLHDLKLLDWQVAAILYMDDGHLESKLRADGSEYKRVGIATDNFSEADNIMLRNAIAERLGVHFDVQRAQGRNHVYYRLRANKDNAERFLHGVAPHVLKSFQYKLERLAPQSTEADDIVCSAQQCAVSAEMTD